MLARVPGGGAVIAASGAGATVLCDPMVDPRGGAYTVGLGSCGTSRSSRTTARAADHLRERSIDLLPADAVLVGIDEQTALVRDGPTASGASIGAGDVTVYRRRRATAEDARADGAPRRRSSGGPATSR